MHSAPYFTALGLLAIVHAAAVIRLRRKHKIGMGHGDNKELARRIRVFGNFAEYAPLGLLLILGLDLVQAPVWYLHLCGMLLLLGRMLHAFGLGQTAGYSSGRTFGMVLTLTSLFLGSIGVSLFTFLTP